MLDVYSILLLLISSLLIFTASTLIIDIYIVYIFKKLNFVCLGLGNFNWYIWHNRLNSHPIQNPTPPTWTYAVECLFNNK